ncbi:hypothetical protein V8F20_000823 [Naviculisporaceae sp. PSN 640]
MDPNSPESADLSPNPSTASGERRQPTYTTVGSIYNPDATTPIQPPTRRPRVRRFQPTAQSPIESLSFQNSLLAALPVKDTTTPASPTPGANRVPQYSQLQQNYDRAVSPPNVDERPTILSAIGMSAPRVRSGNLPPPNLDFDISLSEDPASSDIHEDEESILQAANAFSFKEFKTPSLINLASFPNPMQKAAKITLARARSFHGGAARADTPASLSQDSARTRTDPVFGPPTTTAGAPRPLEAGPPGRRQFNQSTFEGTIKALRLGQETQTNPSHPPAGGMQSKSDSNLVELPKTHTESYGSLSLAGYYPRMVDIIDPLFGHTTSASHSINSLMAATEPIVRRGDNEDGPPKLTHDTLPLRAIEAYYPHGGLTNASGRYEEIPDDWIDQYPLRDNGYPHGPEDENERLAKINRKFYSGTERFFKAIDQDRMDGNHRRFTKNPGFPGVIGGERKRDQTRPDDSDTIRRTDGRIQPRPLSIEEANAMDDCVHAAPLLSMAYETLKQWKEAVDDGSLSGNRWGPSFSRTDPAYIDTSEGGNNSFFSQEKADLPKKKKLVKKIRRGY